MNLRYIALFMDSDSGFGESLQNEFNFKSRFISNYLTKQVRRLKLVTDGSFNMIAVKACKNVHETAKVIGKNALMISVPFNAEAFSDMNEKARYEYFLELLREGYKVASHYKNIPTEELVNLNTNFKNDGYKNVWVHKRKTFKCHNLKVELCCNFTSTHFELAININDTENGETILGTIFRTAPYEEAFQPLFKDILIEGKNLVITEAFDRPKVLLPLEKIQRGELSFKVLDTGLKYKEYA